MAARKASKKSTTNTETLDAIVYDLKKDLLKIRRKTAIKRADKPEKALEWLRSVASDSNGTYSKTDRKNAQVVQRLLGAVAEGFDALDKHFARLDNACRM
jgi:ribosomal protein L29